MQISTLTMKNFRCYYGQHDPLDLTTSDTAHVILVFGENMKGKTSLLQAIRWCLYGVAYDRQGRRIPLVDPETKEQLLSRSAESQGDYTVSVELQFTDHDQVYVLKREASAATLTAPASDADFRVNKSLRSGTRVFAEDMVDTHVQNILNEDISRFFLFDAEMLEEYEDLLKDPDHEALAVKEAIEKILGLPALRVFSPLREDAEEAEQRQNAHLRKREKHAALLEEVAILENAIRGFKSDRATLTEQRTKLSQRAAEAELAVRQNADLDAKIKQKNLLESQHDAEKDRRDGNRSRMAEIIHDTWWLPVVPQVGVRLANLRDERREAMAALQSLYRLEDLEQSSDAKECVLCHSALDHSRLRSLQAEAMQLKLANYGRDVASILDTARRADVYEQFDAQDAISEMRLLQQLDAESESVLADLETRITDLGNSMNGRSYGDYNTKYDRWQRLCGEVKNLDDAITEMSKQQREAEEAHTKKQAQLNRLPDADPKLALETAAYRALADIFEAAVDEFRDSLRGTVGADASDIFRSLTTEKAYQGLRIDENYGLALLDSQGEPVPGRSAGAEQVVALSLIGGLNRAAVREGPVVMDSNFARLDLGHRENVLKFLPHLGHQVIVLVHSGEIDKETDLDACGVRVARRYEIVRDTETQTRIVPEAV